MEDVKVSTFSQILLWFGAAVSIAEIITGTLLAPLGLVQGMEAILLGHLIGAAILFPAGYIGAHSGLSASRSVRISFGIYGSYAFSVLNVLQLVGWTAIMIVSGAKALDGVTEVLWHMQSEAMGCLLIGGLICLWILLGIKGLERVNIVIMALLFASTAVLGAVVFGHMGEVLPITAESITFGEAVELNVVMGLSWLPLISDYTRYLRYKGMGTLGSVSGYISGSVFMFSIGLGAAIYAGTSDISSILLAVGMGLTALLIVVLSTVTTTFLDAFSAGVSLANLYEGLSEKWAAIAIAVIGTVMAVFISMDQYENFLYFIGSVFAPLFAILFVDYYLLGRQTIDGACQIDMRNILLWIIGFVAYHCLVDSSTIVGITLPVMMGTGILAFAVGSVSRSRAAGLDRK